MDFLKFIVDGVAYYHNDVDLDFLLRQCHYLDKEERSQVVRAFYFAKEAHEGTFREGGEPYFSHPFTVAVYATYFQLPLRVVLACLFHDVVEDTAFPLSFIEEQFGKEVAILVDGVTKLKDFHNKEEKDAVNVSKLFRSTLHLSPEVFLIKLLDNSHNMSTIHKKKRREKQIENSLEAQRLYVPMARNLGCGEVRRALENLSYQSLDPEMYQQLERDQQELWNDSIEETDKIEQEISKKLKERGISSTIRYRMKGIYGIHNALLQGLNYHQIHDLKSLKVTVPTEEDCYRALEPIHQIIHPTQFHMRDYIAMPKTNGYQALHTTGLTTDGTQYQVQIRTPKMMEIAEQGVMVFSKQKGDTVRDELEHFQFYKILKELDKMIPNDIEFYQALKEQILSEHIYVTLMDGTKRELPKNSTVLDLVCSLGVEEILHFSTAVRNGEQVPLGTVLHDKDSVFVYSSSQEVYPKKTIVRDCKTPYAKVLLTDLSHTVH